MAEKEEFIVGPGACRLSGGQQQRTAIARAIYCDSDLYLIDDCFSSVDPQVAHKIFNKSFKVLAQKQNKTVIFSTTQFKYARLADEQILVLNGEVIQDSH